MGQGKRPLHRVQTVPFEQRACEPTTENSLLTFSNSLSWISIFSLTLSLNLLIVSPWKQRAAFNKCSTNLKVFSKCSYYFTYHLTRKKNWKKQTLTQSLNLLFNSFVKDTLHRGFQSFQNCLRTKNNSTYVGNSDQERSSKCLINFLPEGENYVKKKKIQKGWVGDIKLLNKSTFLKYREKMIHALPY